ncbi:flagellar basal body rod C-terminal domain-containing protein, partial [Tardiphaga sp.]|uniref:flagellar basal body rod C-terminal domain-containing protein n=1 Tax=Tardiphaga sp. TaxID=1926292 RepID=UPI0037DA7069
NQVTVFTGSGVQLVTNEAATLSFNSQGTITPGTQWNADPSKSGLGSVMMTFPDGASVNLTAQGAFKSGTIAAYTELRDKTLVEAQAQLDQFAGAVSSALSDKTTPGTATTVGAESGFNLDLADMKAGNIIHLTYTDAVTGTQRQVSVVRVDDPNVLPLSNNVTADPNDQVVGIDFTGDVAAQLNAALGGQMQFSLTGNNLTVLNRTNFSTVNAASVTTTQTAFSDGSPQIALFTDNGSPYTGAISGSGSQLTGLAGRLSVNAAVVSDPSRLVVSSTGGLAGDTKRAAFILDQLNNASFTYSPQTGVGSTGTPFQGTLLSYMRQFVSQQGAAASEAKQLADGQNVVLNTLDKKMADTSGVNMDDEMAHLLALQNAYSANARVMSTVNEMYKTMLQAF